MAIMAWLESRDSIGSLEIAPAAKKKKKKKPLLL